MGKHEHIQLGFRHPASEQELPVSKSKNYPWLEFQATLVPHVSTNAERAGQQGQDRSVFWKGRGKIPLAYTCLESVCGATAPDHLGFGNLVTLSHH